jgi:hypothetical protein
VQKNTSLFLFLAIIIILLKENKRRDAKKTKGTRKKIALRTDNNPSMFAMSNKIFDDFLCQSSLTKNPTTTLLMLEI